MRLRDTAVRALCLAPGSLRQLQRARQKHAPFSLEAKPQRLEVCGHAQQAQQTFLPKRSETNQARHA